MLTINSWLPRWCPRYVPLPLLPELMFPRSGRYLRPRRERLGHLGRVHRLPRRAEDRRHQLREDRRAAHDWADPGWGEVHVPLRGRQGPPLQEGNQWGPCDEDSPGLHHRCLSRPDCGPSGLSEAT